MARERVRLEPVVKAAVMVIPALQAAGMLLVAREIHGRVPPTAIFALPLAYAYPFQFGFVNFSLSVAFAFLLFALWLRLTRHRQWRLRAAIFIPASFLLWLTHTYGWGLFGLMVGGTELVRRREEGQGWLMAAVLAGLTGLMLAGPAILVLNAGSTATGPNTGHWFQFSTKLDYVTAVFRDRWGWFDAAALIAIGLVLIRACVRPDYRFDRRLGLIALLFIAAFLLMPRVFLYSAYADMRLVPVMLAACILAIKPVIDTKLARRLALTGLAILLVRVAGLTISTTAYDQSWTQTAAAIDHIPRHARVLALVGRTCAQPWNAAKLEHVPALAIVRRHAFLNDQWALSTAQLLQVTKKDAPGFAEDPSQMAVDKSCPHPEWRQIDKTLARFPRAAFDYVWMIAPPKFDPAGLKGLERKWTNGRDSLYRVLPAEKPKPDL